MEMYDLRIIRKIQETLKAAGITALLRDMYTPTLNAYVYDWPLFLKSLGYDIEGEDAPLAHHTKSKYCNSQFVIWPGDKVIADIVLDLPEHGREYFLGRCGTGDPFKDAVMIAALSKYSVFDIKRFAVKKIQLIVNEIWSKQTAIR